MLRLGEWVGVGGGGSRPFQKGLLRFWKEEELNLKEGSLLEGKGIGGELWVSSHPRRGEEELGCSGLCPAGTLTESKGGKVRYTV